MWEITHDFLYAAEKEPERFGAKSQVGYSEEHTRIPIIAAAIGFESEPLPTAGEKVAFRLYDDDDELYYQGVLDDDDECLNQSAALSWGEGDSGCTTIRVWRWREGAWKVEIG
jgi:hypothetical protein